jgi:Cytochrome c554 and c-prime
MCVLKKSAVAVAALMAALVISAGCPREEGTAAKPEKPSSDAAASAVTSTSIEAPPNKTADKLPADQVRDDKLAIPESSKKPADQRQTPDKTASSGDTKPLSAADASRGDAASRSAPAPDDPLLQDWPKPAAVIVATGMQMGYIEPCGCSGKENQKGGLSRRHSYLKKLAASGLTVVPVDVGEQVRRFGNQSEIKFQATADALKTMKYGAVALGTDDLRLPVQSLLAAVADSPDNPGPFVSANAALISFEQTYMPRLRIVPAGKLKLGVTAIIGDSAQRAISNDDIKFKPAAEALKEILPDLQKAHCDRLILLAHATKEESIALAKQFPAFDFVITSGGAPEPSSEPIVVEGTKTRLVEVGQKGEYANVIGLFDDSREPVRFRVVPLAARLGESDEMHQLMASYQDQLKQLELSGLGLVPTPHRSGRQFVGSKVCGDCHTKAYAVWKETPHAKALDTLANLKPSRQYDPECLSCHVTGWEPQKFYPFQGGYASLDKTPLLAHNGCENCHGPGSAHVAAETGDAKLADKEIADRRAAMRAVKSADTCIQCHDDDNSIKFDFKTYWPKVEHHGKD